MFNIRQRLAARVLKKFFKLDWRFKALMVLLEDNAQHQVVLVANALSTAMSQVRYLLGGKFTVPNLESPEMTRFIAYFFVQNLEDSSIVKELMNGVLSR